VTVPAGTFAAADTATVTRLPAQVASVPAQVIGVPGQVAGLPAQMASIPDKPALAAATPAKTVRTGWIIQVGAYPEESIARQQLTSVKNKAARLLAKADAFTESVPRGDTTYFRARFAGLDKDQAEAACKYLKRNDVDCVAIKN
jgi:D-alanyl-D-alanine carboxypeptidase